jgi:hypothetical protein
MVIIEALLTLNEKNGSSVIDIFFTAIEIVDGEFGFSTDQVIKILNNGAKTGLFIKLCSPPDDDNFYYKYNKNAIESNYANRKICISGDCARFLPDLSGPTLMPLKSNFQKF